MPKFKYQDGDFINGIKMIKRTEKRGKHWYGEFLCSTCHEPFITRLDAVKSGKINCNKCAAKIWGQKIAKDLTGKRFGRLVALEPTDKRALLDGSVIWKCRCDCGNEEVFISVKDLNSNHTHSCGCLKSYYEHQIKNFLEELNINFIKEWTQEECRNPKTNALLRFDFYLPDYNLCIEYQGEQHYTGWKGQKNSLEEIKFRDEIKKQYCINNNINLYYISYLDREKISKNYMENILNDYTI